MSPPDVVPFRSIPTPGEDQPASAADAIAGAVLAAITPRLDALQRLIGVTPTEQRLAVTKKELAALLGCSTKHIERMVSAGELFAPIRMGAQKLVWPVDAVREWLALGCPDAATFERVRRSRGRDLTSANK